MSQQKERERITDQIDLMIFELDIDIGLSVSLDLSVVTDEMKAKIEVLNELKTWIDQLDQ